MGLYLKSVQPGQGWIRIFDAGLPNLYIHGFASLRIVRYLFQTSIISIGRRIDDFWTRRFTTLLRSCSGSLLCTSRQLPLHSAELHPMLLSYAFDAFSRVNPVKHVNFVSKKTFAVYKDH